MSGEPANRPEYGDPEILPKGTIKRPSAERMPFGPSGELLAEGPKLPEGYLRAPDVKDFNWTRKRGDEWTDETFRAEILSFISDFFSSHSWVRTWAVVEKTGGGRPGRYRFPVLVFRFSEADGTTYEVAQEFPEADRTGTTLANRLLQVTITMEILRP